MEKKGVAVYACWPNVEEYTITDGRIDFIGTPIFVKTLDDAHYLLRSWHRKFGTFGAITLMAKE